MKKGQIFSTEVYVAIVLFLVALVAFYFMIAQRDTGETAEEEAERIAGNLLGHPYFADGVLDVDEMDNITANWNCTYMKEIFGTSKSVCIYVKDEAGNLEPMIGSEPFLGCPDIVIGGENCTEPTP